MRRFLCLTLAAAAVLMLFPATLLAASSSQGVCNTYVNLRSEPSTSSAIVTVVVPGKAFAILSSQNGWVRVTYNEKTGYIRSDLVQAAGASTGLSGSAVTKTSVNLRQSASTSGRVITVLAPETGVTITGQSGDWYAVTSGAHSGYIRGDLLRAGSAAATTTPTDTSVAGRTATTTARLNLRAGASTSSAVLYTLPAGTAVTLRGLSGDFYQVTFSSYTGYAHRDYLQLTATQTTRTDLRRGSSGQAVTELQVALRTLGYYTAAADGNFGALTEQAVRKFQASAGATQDGVVGPRTWEKLDAALAGANSTTTTAPSTPATARPTLKQGSNGQAVKDLQTLLKAVGVYNSTIDGDFGNGTRNAVIKYQQANGLTADGIVGPLTWAKLESSPTAPAATGTLQKGSTGAEVTKLQNRLIELGYYSGSADGTYGDATVAAVKAFQARNGSTADGIAGPATLTKVYASTAIKNSTSSAVNPGLSGTTVRDVQLYNWWTNTKYIPVNVKLQFTDVRTGRVFYMASFSNGNHADVEPVTADDTRIMYELWGNKWSWNTRPVWVTWTKDGVTHSVAGSLNGMPHAGQTNTTNNMDGQVCLHLYQSRTHNTNKVDASHQASVMEAYNAAKALGIAR